MQATIEIKSRLVDAPLPNNAQHMYIVYTNEAGEKYVLRGNPEHETIEGVLFDDILVQDTLYKNSLDFDEYGNHKSQTIFTGTNTEMLEKIQLARTEMARINSEGYDYNLPIFETLLANTTWSNLSKQNSNTVAVRLAEVMGLKSKVTNFIETNNLNTPGSNATLEHSAFEKSATFLYESLQQAGHSVSDLFSSVKETAGNFFSDTQSFFSGLFSKEAQDHQSKIDPSTINNTQLNLEINTTLTSGFAGSNDLGQIGNIIGDADYHLTAPILHLNGDGLKNVAPYSIASDNFRPGNSELSDYANFNTELKADFSRLDNLMNNQSNQQLNFQLQNPLANITNNTINARTFLNIDPVVLDLNGFLRKENSPKWLFLAKTSEGYAARSGGRMGYFRDLFSSRVFYGNDNLAENNGLKILANDNNNAIIDSPSRIRFSSEVAYA